MPYYPNSPRFEFSHADRTSLQTQAVALLAGLALQRAGTPIPRSTFDSYSTAVNSLTPTYNQTPPYQEVIP